MKKNVLKCVAALLAIAFVSCSSGDGDSDDFPSSSDVNAFVVNVSIPERKGENPFKNFIGKKLKKDSKSNGGYKAYEIADDTFTFIEYDADSGSLQKYTYEYSYDVDEKLVFGKVKSYSLTLGGKTVAASSAGEFFKKALDASGGNTTNASVAIYQHANIFSQNVSFSYLINNGKIELYNYCKSLEESTNAGFSNAAFDVDFSEGVFYLDDGSGDYNMCYITKIDGLKFSGTVIKQHNSDYSMSVEGTFAGEYQMFEISGGKTVEWSFTKLPSYLKTFEKVDYSGNAFNSLECEIELE